MKSQPSVPACKGTALLLLSVLLSLPLHVFAAPRSPWPLFPERTMAIFSFDEGFRSSPFAPRPIGMDDAAVVESWNGYSLARDPFSTVAPVALPVIDGEGKSRVSYQSGAIRFWIAPAWSSGSGPENYGRLLELIETVGGGVDVYWSLFFDPAGNAIYLSSGHDTTATLVAPIDWSANRWHLVQLFYSPTNSLLFIDASAVASGGGLQAPTQWQQSSLGLLIGSDAAASAASVAGACFEEVTTFDYWPNEAQSQAYYRCAFKEMQMGPVDTEAGTQTQGFGGEQMLAEDPAPPCTNCFSGSDPGVTNSAVQWPGTNGFYILPPVLGTNYDALLSVKDWTNGTPRTNQIYDIFKSSLMTTTSWVHAAHGVVDQTNFTILNLTNAYWFFLAARTNDSDADGLSDALENLVYGLNEFLYDTDGDGASDGEEIAAGTDPFNAASVLPVRMLTLKFEDADQVGTYSGTSNQLAP